MSPSPARNPGVAGGQVRARDLEVEERLANGLVTGVDEALGFPRVFGTEAGLTAGGGVFAVVGGAASKQNKP